MPWEYRRLRTRSQRTPLRDSAARMRYSTQELDEKVSAVERRRSWATTANSDDRTAPLQNTVGLPQPMPRSQADQGRLLPSCHFQIHLVPPSHYMRTSQMSNAAAALNH